MKREEFKNTPESVLLDNIEVPIKETRKNTSESNKRLKSIEKVLRDHLYFLKDSKDDGKKVHTELKKLTAMIKKGSVGGRSGSGQSAGGDGDGGINVFGGKLGGKKQPKDGPEGGKKQSKKSKLPSGKKVKVGGSILTAIYGGVRGQEDYAKLMNVKDTEMNLKQMLSGTVSGIIGAVGDVIEIASFGYIKSWKSDELIKSIDKTINNFFAPIEKHYEKFKTNFPTIGKIFDTGFQVISDGIWLVTDIWGGVFDKVENFVKDVSGGIYDVLFDTTEADRRKKAEKIGNEKAKILYNESKAKELEEKIEGTKKERAKYEKDSKVYEGFTKMIEKYTKQLEELSKQNEQYNINIRNITSSGQGIGGKGTQGYEGFRSQIYLDTEKNPTIGYGHKLTKSDISSGRFANGITEAEAQKLYEEDKAKHDKLLYDKYPWVASQPASVRMALEDMAYNMGVGDGKGLSSFNTAMEDIRTGNYESASNKILRSRYAQQTGQRAVDNANRIRLASDNVNPKETRTIPTANGGGNGGNTTIVNNTTTGGGNNGRPSVHDTSLDSTDNVYNIEASGASAVS